MSRTRRKEIPSIPDFSDPCPSNSTVANPCMLENVYNAATVGVPETLIQLEKVYLLNEDQRETFLNTVTHAVIRQNLCALQNLFSISAHNVRHLTPASVSVNSITPFIITRAITGERSDVDILRLFLNLGLNVRKVFGQQGDALMWAVRLGRWELIERILTTLGPNLDPDAVRLHKYERRFTLLAVAADRIRIADELHHFGAADSEEIPIWADQKRLVLELLNRGAQVSKTCLLPNLAADQQRKEQSVALARMLIDEYAADPNERFDNMSVMHRRYSREPVSTALYEAVRNNFPAMVELLIDKGAALTVQGSHGYDLVECAWRNKHGGMVLLLRERGVPEGSGTRDLDVAAIHVARNVGRERPGRPGREYDSDDEDEYEEDEDWREGSYRAILP